MDMLEQSTPFGTAKVVRTSRLYESAPIYELDQGRFINAVVEVRLTTLFTNDSTLMGNDNRSRPI